MPNDEMAQAFIAAQGEKPSRPQRVKQPGTSLAYKSEKQALKEEYLRGVKAGFLYMLGRLDPDGPTCESCGVKGNASTLDLDHIIPRARSGHDRPDNLQLLCNRFHTAGNDCHSQKHGRPQFGGGNG